MFNEFEGDRAVGQLAGYQIEQGAKGLVPSGARQTEMTHMLEAGELNKLSQVERETTEGLSKAMRAVRDGAVAKGVPMGDIIENYATHAYVRGMNSKESILQNALNAMNPERGTGGGMSPKSRWALQRTIPTLRAAQERGLIPVTTKLPEIARMYIDSVSRTVANKQFLDALAARSMPDGVPLLVRGDALKALSKTHIDERMGFEGPLPRAAHEMVAEIMAVKSPKDYVFINHPQLRDFKVHRDMAPPLKAMFDATDPVAYERAAHSAAIMAKSLIFSGSLFHAKSLVDAAIGVSATGAPFRRGALKAIRDPSNGLVKEAVRGGLNIIDRPMEAEIAPVRNMFRLLEEKMPYGTGVVPKALRVTQDGMNHFLWGVVHPVLKFNTWSAIYGRALRDPTFMNQVGRKIGMAPNWTGVAKPQIARMAAEFTNDIFGGINWFKIANDVHSKYGRDVALAFASPRGRRLMQIMMLAPDWTVATARSMYKAIPGMSEPQVAALHRQYLARQLIVYLTAYDAINVGLSGHHIWQNKDPTMLDNGDGTRTQMAKHTMEPVHWLTQPRQQAWNKLGYPIKEPILQLMDKDWISLKGKDISGPPMENRLTHALKSMLPIPATTMANQGPASAISGMFGVPRYGQTEQQAIDAAIERALRMGPQRAEEAADRAKARGADEEKARTRSRAYNTPEAAEKRVKKQYDRYRKEQDVREGKQ